MRSRRIRVLVGQAQEGGMFGIPCLCNSPNTPSSVGALSPRGSGSHGFDNTSSIAASMLSFDCIFQTHKSNESLIHSISY